jgi:hypothetical protein
MLMPKLGSSSLLNNGGTSETRTVLWRSLNRRATKLINKQHRISVTEDDAVVTLAIPSE